MNKIKPISTFSSVILAYLFVLLLPLLLIPFKCYSEDLKSTASDETVTTESSTPDNSKATAKEQKKYRKSGTLASSTSGVGHTATDTWADTDASGDSSQPIDGSISNLGSNKWLLKLFNNSVNVVSATVAVVQLDSAGKEVKKTSYSYTLPAKGKVEIPVATNSTTANCRVDLTSWKSSGKKGGFDKEKDIEDKNS